MAGQYLIEHLDGIEIGDRVFLEGPEAHHAASVSRVRVGEHVRVGDGQGRVVAGAVTEASREGVVVLVEQFEHEAPPRLGLTLVQALAKGDRDELAVQAATELGVSGVIPWQAQRSVSRWTGPKIRKGVERWRTIVREAAKQSLRAYVPEVGEPVDTAVLARETREATERAEAVIVLDPTAAVSLVEICQSDARVTSAKHATLIVGPEGGISDPELDTLEESGALRARLGANVLRTSTAGPAAIAVVQGLCGTWAVDVGA